MRLNNIVKVVLRILSLLIFLVSLTSCQANIRHYFQKPPCSTPCWQNIRPGLTSGEEAKQILSEKMQLHDVRIGNSSWGSNGYTIRADFDKTQGVEIYIQDDLVEAIWISSSGVRDLNLSIADVIEVYGEPQYVYINEYIAGDEFGYYINLLYPLRNMLIRMTDGGSEGYVDIRKKEKVSDIIFMKYNEYMDFVTAKADEYKRFDLEKVLPWEGYRKYCLPIEWCTSCSAW